MCLDDEDEDSETAAGLLMTAAGRVPTSGFTHETKGVHFEVLRADTTRLLEVAVHRQEPPETGEDDEPSVVANGG